MMVMEFGYFAALEQHPPVKLLEHGALAEKCGFDLIMGSDHFHPWWHTGGQGAFAWAWIGLMCERTKRVKVGTGVTCPILRYNPALVAQAFATLGVLFPGRVFLGVGAGEAMNEVPMGHHWPTPGERVKRLGEAIEVIRRLWLEDFVDFEGEYYTLKNANLYTKPKEPIPLLVAAAGKKTAELAGKYADGILTVPLPEKAYKEKLFPSLEKGARNMGRDPKVIKKHVELWVSYDEDYDRALNSARFWSGTLLIPEVFDIADPREIEEMGRAKVSEEDFKRSGWIIETDIEKHLKRIERYIKLGFDTITFLSSSPDQEKFIRTYGEKVLPHLRESQRRD